MRLLFTRLIFVVLLIQLAACAKIDGSVFLDLNGDLNRDADESRLADMDVTITLDGEEIDTVTTDADGKFELEIREIGEFCASVEDSEVSSENITIASRWLAPFYSIKRTGLRMASRVLNNLHIAPAWAVDEICDNGQDDDLDLKIDCLDRSCIGDSSCPDLEATETSCDDSVDNDIDGKTDCDDSNCSGISGCDSTSTSSGTDATVALGQACTSSDGKLVALNIPVSLSITDDVTVVNGEFTEGTVDGEFTAGEVITLVTTITNNSVVDFASSDMTLTVTTPTSVLSRSFSLSNGDTCSAAQETTCTFALDASDNITLTSTFTLPATIASSDTFEVAASLVVDFNGTTETIADSDTLNATATE